MTLNSITTKVTYNGDGATTEFAVSFVFWNNSDLRVIHRDANGAETVWTEGAHYNLSGGDGATGTLTVIDAPTDYTPLAGQSLTIRDNQAETQGDSLPLSGTFPSTLVEQRFDKITRLIQIHSEEIARAILLPETASLLDMRIPEPGAGELLRYNSGGTQLETVALADLDLTLATLLTGLAAGDFLKYDGINWVNRTPANVRADLGAGAAGDALFQDATAADARATLGLGTAATGVIGVDVQAYDADTAKTDTVQNWTAAQSGAVIALSDGANISLDLSLSNNFSVTLAGNRTLDNPTNIVAGQSGVITVTQDATGSRTLAYGTYYKFAGGTAPTLTTTASAIDTLFYYVKSSTEILVSSALGWA